MELTIHRGTKEIGGTCVELRTNNSRIIVDLGIPLVSVRKDQPFDSKVLEGKSVKQLLDLGIALGSAVKQASKLNIDNRMMYTIGVAAKKTGLLDSDVIIGIPLSVTGKSPYFDR